MRKAAVIVALVGGLWWVGASSVQAATVDLAEWAFYIDGAVSDSLASDPVPAGVSDAGFNYGTGLGTLTISVSGAGSHVVGLFLDHEIDQLVNGFSNESGAAVNLGSKPAGLSWEIDEPEWVFGDIFTNFTAGTLDNSNPAGMWPDDVSMALLWSFDLFTGQSAILTFTVSDVAPLGFYLSQTDPDPDSNYTIYMTGGLGLTGGPTTVPEPASLLVLTAGLAGLAAAGLRARRSRRRR